MVLSVAHIHLRTSFSGEEAEKESEEGALHKMAFSCPGHHCPQRVCAPSPGLKNRDSGQIPWVL